MRNLNEILGSKDELYRNMGDNWKSVLRVACPGIIQSFDAKTQTVTVQPVIREHINNGSSKEWVELPILLDVPIVIPRAGDFALTMPIKPGDECLVIFADMCIDAWFSFGGIQNQLEKRRHDLSDAIAIIGMWSQPNRIPNYSTNSTQLRTLDGETYIELKPKEINIKSSSFKVNGKEVLTAT